MLRAFGICKNISSIPSGTHATPILVISGQVARFWPLCQTGLEISTFSFLSVFVGPIRNSGYPKHCTRSTSWITRRLTKLSHFKFYLVFTWLSFRLSLKAPLVAIWLWLTSILFRFESDGYWNSPLKSSYWKPWKNGSYRLKLCSPIGETKAFLCLIGLVDWCDLRWNIGIGGFY